MSPVLIDHRAGSEELICHPPFSICPVCSSPLTIERNPSGKRKGNSASILSATCPRNPLHSPLAHLVDLASICGTGRSSADVHFTGRGPNNTRTTIGVELSKYSDFISKLRSGRFHGQKGEGKTQLSSMLELYDEVWILVYGAYKPNPNTNALQVMRRDTSGRYGWVDYRAGSKQPIPYTYHERFLHSPSLTSIPKLRTWRVWTIEEAAYWIGEVLYPLRQRAYESHRSLHALDHSITLPSLAPDTPAHIRKAAGIAKEFPGLRDKRAVVAAEWFDGDIRAMINADEKEWLKVPGIGPVIAAGIVRYIRGR